MLSKLKYLIVSTTKFHDNTIWPFGGMFLGYKLKDIPDDYLINIKDNHEGKKLNYKYRLLMTYLRRRFPKPKNYKSFKGMRFVNNGLVNKFITGETPEGFNEGLITTAIQIPSKESLLRGVETRKLRGSTVSYAKGKPDLFNPRPDNYIKEYRQNHYFIMYSDYFDDLTCCELCGDIKSNIININERVVSLNLKRKTSYTASDLMRLCNDCQIFLKPYQQHGIRLALWLAHIKYMDTLKPLGDKTLINNKFLKQLL